MFGVFVGFCFVAFLFTAMVLRETAGVSLETIEAEQMAGMEAIPVH